MANLRSMKFSLPKKSFFEWIDFWGEGLILESFFTFSPKFQVFFGIVVV